MFAFGGKFSACSRSGVFLLLLVNWAFAQASSPLSKKDLAQLIKTAKTPAEYQRLSKYFHYQEAFYQAKAQALLDDYALSSARFTMATKTVSRADVVKRTYKDLVHKQKESAAAAAEYDERLESMGIKPEYQTSNVVSLPTLKDESKLQHN